MEVKHGLKKDPQWMIDCIGVTGRGLLKGIAQALVLLISRLWVRVPVVTLVPLSEILPLILLSPWMEH